MNDKPDYYAVARRSPVHGAILFAGIIASIAGLFRGTWWPFAFFAVVELVYFFVVPATPWYRRKVDVEHAEELLRQRALELERIANALSPNAKSRLNGIVRLKGKILDSLKTLGEKTSLETEWTVRLDGLVNAALRILVAVDGTRADDRDARHLESQIKELHAELARLNDGPAKAAKQQRLEVLQRRSGGLGFTREQREAAIVQLETIEDLLQEMLATGLSGRDAGAFGERIGKLQAQIEAATESVGALDRHAELQAELARR
ncbi:MAG: hypothetical protein ACK4N5_22540 [Myxococcales bacterium]